MAAKKTTRPVEAKKANANSGKKVNGDAPLGLEAEMWQAADTLRGSMEPSSYKHVVLPLLFLKHVSDAFEHKHQELEKTKEEDPEDRDHYTADGIFWVPKASRWSGLQKKAKEPNIGQLIDKAMEQIEKENPSLLGVLPKDFGRPEVDKTRLGQLIDQLSTLDLAAGAHGGKDLLGRVYEYFLTRFAAAEGRAGGEFYTPKSVVRVLVEMLEPFKGRVYDPCCGSGGMFVQSERFVEEHGGKLGDIAVYGQELTAATWRLAKMNLAVRGIEADLGTQWGDTFQNDLHPGLKADFILANPPFNVSDWGADKLKNDVRWKYGMPPTGNANFAWLQHMIHHLSANGVMGTVLANGSMASNQSGEGELRKALIEADLVDCMVAMPGQLFLTVQIPVCLWILAKNKADKRCRDRRNEFLFIDARKLGFMADRTRRDFTDDDIAKVAKTYHAWRGQKDAGRYKDVLGFCKSASLDEVRGHYHALTPGRYVGAEDVEDDDEPFEVRFPTLVAKLEGLFAQGKELEKRIKSRLKGLNAR